MPFTGLSLICRCRFGIGRVKQRWRHRKIIAQFMIWTPISSWGKYWLRKKVKEMESWEVNNDTFVCVEMDHIKICCWDWCGSFFWYQPQQTDAHLHLACLIRVLNFLFGLAKGFNEDIDLALYKTTYPTCFQGHNVKNFFLTSKEQKFSWSQDRKSVV